MISRILPNIVCTQGMKAFARRECVIVFASEQALGASLSSTILDKLRNLSSQIISKCCVTLEIYNYVSGIGFSTPGRGPTGKYLSLPKLNDKKENLAALRLTERTSKTTVPSV